MEDSSSWRNCKRSDGGIEEEAMDSSTAGSFSKKKMKKTTTDGDDKLELAELKLSTPPSAKIPDRGIRLCFSLAESNSSSAASRHLLFDDGDSRSGATDSRASAGCCLSNVQSSGRCVKGNRVAVVDLEAKSYEAESSSTCINSKFREATPSGRLSSEEKDMADSSAKAETTTTMEKTKLKKTKTTTPAAAASSSQSGPPPAVVKVSPNQDEIEEFLAAAENEQRKRFAEKYNFDVVKDVPLEGQYQWVRLKP